MISVYATFNYAKTQPPVQTSCFLPSLNASATLPSKVSLSDRQDGSSQLSIPTAGFCGYVDLLTCTFQAFTSAELMRIRLVAMLFFFFT